MHPHTAAHPQSRPAATEERPSAHREGCGGFWPRPGRQRLESGVRGERREGAEGGPEVTDRWRLLGPCRSQRRRCPHRSRRQSGAGRGGVGACSAHPGRSGVGVPRQVPAPRGALSAGGRAKAGRCEARGERSVGAERGGGAPGGERGKAAAEGQQADAGAATSGLRRRAPAAPGASGDIGPRQLKGEDGLRRLVESETFACARCRHVSRDGHPRQEAPQREYPPAGTRRSPGSGASAPVGRRPLLPAPSPAGGRCPPRPRPRPRRLPLFAVASPFPLGARPLGWAGAGGWDTVRSPFSSRMCWAFLRLQQQDSGWFCRSSRSSLSLHTSPLPFSYFTVRGTEGRGCFGQWRD